jgi:mannose/fructose/N-acetylgalactosamine-specific phosphotransferase system component IIC
MQSMPDPNLHAHARLWALGTVGMILIYGFDSTRRVIMPFAVQMLSAIWIMVMLVLVYRDWKHATEQTCRELETVQWVAYVYYGFLIWFRYHPR